MQPSPALVGAWAGRWRLSERDTTRRTSQRQYNCARRREATKTNTHGKPVLQSAD